MVQNSSAAATGRQALLQPTYQNRLRVIGDHLDEGRYQAISVFEIEGGFIVRATRHGARRPEALEFPDDQFPELMRKAIDTRGERQSYARRQSVLPTGYEDFLRALGFLLDNQMASNIMLCELAEYILVTGNEPSNATSGHIAVRPFERYLRPDDIQRVLDDSFSRRTDTPRRPILGIF